MKARLIIIISFLAMVIPLKGTCQNSIPFHCEKDSSEIRELIRTLASEKEASFNKRVAEAAKSLVGKGADDGLTSDSLYKLRVNVDTFTPMSFVNSCLALGKASLTPGAAWRSYAEAIRNYSCRKGEDDGFSSLFYHTSDWIGDNVYRGNFTEMTDRVEGTRNKTWSLDYLTFNNEDIPALSNPETLDKVRMTEMGFRTHKIPYLPKQSITNKEIASDLRDGDIIILISDKERSDFHTFGVVSIEADGPHLIHFDRKQGIVVKEPEPLKRYFNLMAKHFSGFRWIRPL
ncbi:MAG: DUF1460 domain-containing protein [Muribaculaceae bacterium]|nr:DUF1460 domain-containing protein [Muribaculaceae bacterium]